MDKLDRMHREIGKLYMENVLLRQALSEEQQEIARATTELGYLRQRNEKLIQTSRTQAADLVALSERVMGKRADREYVAER